MAETPRSTITASGNSRIISTKAGSGTKLTYSREYALEQVQFADRLAQKMLKEIGNLYDVVEPFWSQTAIGSIPEDNLISYIPPGPSDQLDRPTMLSDKTKRYFTELRTETSETYEWFRISVLSPLAAIKENAKKGNPPSLKQLSDLYDAMQVYYEKHRMPCEHWFEDFFGPFTKSLSNDMARWPGTNTFKTEYGKFMALMKQYGAELGEVKHDASVEGATHVKIEEKPLPTPRSGETLKDALERTDPVMASLYQRCEQFDMLQKQLNRRFMHVSGVVEALKLSKPPIVTDLKTALAEMQAYTAAAAEAAAAAAKASAAKGRRP